MNEPKDEPIEPKDEPIEPKDEPKYDEDFINELVSKIDKKLDKKLYYGRKQEKSDKKEAKKIENILAESQKDNLGFYIMSGFLIGLSCVMCYFGFKHLEKETLNENNA